MGVSANEPGVVALTGLGSPIGAALTRRLLEDAQRRVVGIDRRRPYRLPDPVRYHRIDLAAPGATARLAELFRGERVEAVVHAAFRTQPSADIEADHELEAIGTLQLLHACAAAKIRRVVLASSTMLYGARPDNPNYLRESHPLRGHPGAHSIANRIEAERHFADFAARDADAEVCVLRSCWALGPAARGPAASHFSLPVVPVVLGYDPLIQLVHELDLLDAFECALLDGHSGIFNVVGKGVVPLSTLLRSAARPSIPIPAALLDLAFELPSRLRSGDPPSAFYDYLRYVWSADGSRAFDAFGEPRYTSAEAWMSFVGHRRLRRYR